MLMKHLTVGKDEIVKVEDGWRIVKVTAWGNEFHVLLQTEEAKEWTSLKEALRS